MIMAEKIYEKDLTEVIENNFVDYAEEVAARRAIPAASDGFKPVTRRVIYAMEELGLACDFESKNEKPYKKCARIVGDTMGKYHPHGDSSIYGALVTSAQDFRNSISPISGYGNFGSWDDGPAAMRYTESRLSLYGTMLIDGLRKKCVPFVPNFDATEMEPQVLPALVPNLLINGTTGIAVGYSSDIPTHNFTESCEVFKWRIENPNGTLKDALKILKGPDFVSGGIVDPNGLYECYETGKGKFTTRAILELSPQPKGKMDIIATCIPYGEKVEPLIEKIAEILQDPKYCFDKIGNESHQNQSCIKISFDKDAPIEEIIDLLFKKTNLQVNFSYNFLATINEKPKVLSLLNYLDFLVEDKTEIVKKINEYDLESAKRNLLIVEAKLLVSANSKEIIEIIQSSKDKQEAISSLSKRFEVSTECAQIITEMRLYTLTKQETSKLVTQKKELEKQIKQLENVLKSKKNIQKDLIARIEKYQSLFTTPRKTKIKKFDNIEVKETSSGDFILQAIKNKYNFLPSNSKAKNGILLNSKQGNTILSFLENGQYVSFYGNAIRKEETSNIIAIINENELDNKFIVHISSDGQIQKTSKEAWSTSKLNKLSNAFKLKQNESIVSILFLDKDEFIVLETQNGMNICFSTEEVRATGNNTSGMRGISLANNDKVVNVYVANKKCIVTKQKRGGKGTKIK